MLIQEITSANAPKAIGPYTPAVKLGDFVYMSGQIPVDPALSLIHISFLENDTPDKPQANDQVQDQAVDLKLDEEDRWERMFEHETCLLYTSPAGRGSFRF